MIQLPFLIGGETIKKYEKEVVQAQLDNEKAVLKALEGNYQDALEEIESKIAQLMGRADADMSHVIYQIEYQRALKKQIEGILLQLQTNEFETVSEYLTTCYEEGFLGTMYAMQSQGVPLVFPINQEEVVAAIQHETNLSSGLYNAFDTKDLQKKIAGEISRGFATGATYKEIARNVSSYTNIGKNNAMRVVRTEGHRITEAAAYNAQLKAKDRGADLVKIWDASLDSKTRPSHVKVDGEIREVEEKYSNGLEYPGDPAGSAAEVINCRCRSRTDARWALDGMETKILGDTSQMTEAQKQRIADKLHVPVEELDQYSDNVIPINAKNYADFKNQYSQLWNYKGSALQKEADARVAKLEEERLARRSKKSNKNLENSAKSGTIDIEIDEFVPCLKNSQTGEIVDTVVREVTDRNALKDYTKKNGWYINWKDVPADCKVCALQLKDDDAFQGLAAYKVDDKNSAVYAHWVVAAPHNQGANKEYSGVGGHLFAIMAEESVNAGYGGFMYGKAANETVMKHYIDKLGAVHIGQLRFFIDEDAAQKLLDEYVFEWVK